MKAYVVSHNGLGDCLFMNGGIRFICNFYDEVTYICKNNWIHNVIDFYKDVKNINFKTITVDAEINNVLTEDLNKNSNIDIFVCGGHKRSKSSKITNSKDIHENISKVTTLNVTLT